MNQADQDPATRLQHLATRLIRIARTSHGAAGITSSQYSAMAVINDKKEISVVNLARLERVSHPTMSRIVAGLVRKGLVIRSPNPADKRSRPLLLTSEGYQLYFSITARRIALFKALLARLSPAAIQEIIEAMDELALPSAHGVWLD